MIIYLDMDEVLCDFTGGACKAHGITRDELEEKRTPGQWDLDKTLGITTTQFWKPINEMGQKFWLELDPLPHCREILELVKSHATELFIVTTPSFHPGCYSGKRMWTNMWLKNYVETQNLIYTSHKYLLAAPDRVLIDDRYSNVSKFTDHGGRGILFPHLGNILCDHAHDPVDFIETSLSNIKKV